MSSDLPKTNHSDDFQAGKWRAYHYQEGRYYFLSEKNLAGKTIKEFLNGSYVLRFDLAQHGRVYFISSDELYWKLTAEGQEIRWLHELFEAIRLDLIKKGLPNTSIYQWKIQDIWAHQAALDVFPGSKVEVRE